MYIKNKKTSKTCVESDQIRYVTKTNEKKLMEIC